MQLCSRSLCNHVSSFHSVMLPPFSLLSNSIRNTNIYANFKKAGSAQQKSLVLSESLRVSRTLNRSSFDRNSSNKTDDASSSKTDNVSSIKSREKDAGDEDDCGLHPSHWPPTAPFYEQPVEDFTDNKGKEASASGSAPRSGMNTLYRQRSEVNGCTPLCPKNTDPGPGHHHQAQGHLATVCARLGEWQPGDSREAHSNPGEGYSCKASCCLSCAVAILGGGPRASGSASSIQGVMEIGLPAPSPKRSGVDALRNADLEHSSRVFISSTDHPYQSHFKPVEMIDVLSQTEKQVQLVWRDANGEQ